MIRYDSLSVQGNQQNEDRVFVNEVFGFVIDGASGLYKEKVTDFASDAQWFAHSLSERLINQLGQLEKSIEEILTVICLEIWQEYQAILKSKELDFHEEWLPNATISIVRQQEKAGYLELFQLGDSPIVVETCEGVLIFDDLVLGANDQRALTEMIRLAKQNQTDLVSERPGVTEILKENRRLKNTENGYWILEPLGKGISHGTYQRLPLDSLKRLAVMSDGFWEAYETLQLYETPALFLNKICSGEPLKQLVEAQRLVQNKDALLNQFPRLKVMDDATVFYYLFFKEKEVDE